MIVDAYIDAALPFRDEWPHAPGPDAAWQESVFLTMQDAASGIAGTFRIGHEPNRDVGHCSFSVSTSEGMGYQRSHRDIPMLGDERRADGFAIDGFVTATFEDGVCNWIAEDDACSVDVSFVDLHPRYHLWRLVAAGAMADVEADFASDTFSIAGTVRGTVRIGDRTWMVDGTGSRDHSWGNRHVGVIANWCWLSGAFGPDLYFAAGGVISRNGDYRPGGYVMRDGWLGSVTALDVIIGVELDGITARDARMTVTTDELGAFELHAVSFAPNTLLDLGTTYLEAFVPCELQLDDGRTTTANFGFGLNPRAGDAPVPTLLNAVHENGISNVVRRNHAKVR